VNDLSNTIEDVVQQIKDKSEKSRNTCDDLLPAFNEWRREEFERIEQSYQEELQVIKNEGETLENFHRDLLEQLDNNARQPLERIQRQQNANIDILNLIRQAIEKVRKENTQLMRSFPSSSTIISEDCVSDFSSPSFSDQISNADIIQDKKEQPASSSSLISGKAF
jgi:transketolase